MKKRSIALFVLLLIIPCIMVAFTQTREEKAFQYEISQISSSLEVIIQNSHRFFDEQSTEYAFNIAGELSNIQMTLGKIHSQHRNLSSEPSAKISKYADLMNGHFSQLEAASQIACIENIFHATETFDTTLRSVETVTSDAFSQSVMQFVSNLYAFPLE